MGLSVVLICPFGYRKYSGVGSMDAAGPVFLIPVACGIQVEWCIAAGVQGTFRGIALAVSAARHVLPESACVKMAALPLLILPRVLSVVV